MKQIKKLFFGFLYILLSILTLTLITTLFSYINFLGDKIIPILQIFISIISYFIGGIYIGKNTSKRRYIDGIKIGFISSIIFILLNILIFNNNFEFKYIFYYIILIFSSALGSMICIKKAS